MHALTNGVIDHQVRGGGHPSSGERYAYITSHGWVREYRQLVLRGHRLIDAHRLRAEFDIDPGGIADIAHVVPHIAVDVGVLKTHGRMISVEVGDGDPRAHGDGMLGKR